MIKVAEQQALAAQGVDAPLEAGGVCTACAEGCEASCEGGV